jgi:hypothetical protein
MYNETPTTFGKMCGVSFSTAFIMTSLLAVNGSVQRTSRRNRLLRDEEKVLELLEAEGIDRERVTTVDISKVDDALDVSELSESDVYEIEESEYVRKAEVDEETKESRLQGLKDQLAATDEDTEELQEEIEEL